MNNILNKINAFEVLFEELQLTSSYNKKRELVSRFKTLYPGLVDDLNYIFETLDGKHPIGWKFKPSDSIPLRMFLNVTEMIRYCESAPNKTFSATARVEQDIGVFGDFLAPIVNRTLRLGIGKSQLAKSDITPMLAKKYQGTALRGDVFVTEKLDGNRCIAAFNPVSDQWEFYSRSGKPLKVDFDMTGMNTDLIYDGEVMSEVQTALSVKRYLSIVDDDVFNETLDMRQSQLMFNETSGLINRKGPKSGLMYNVFDIVSTDPYQKRRELLQTETDFRHSKDIRLLPVLYTGDDIDYVNKLLDRVTQMGGEGIMLNLCNRGYEHKRTDALLKYKQVQHMDMKVVDTYEGTGKYNGLVGGISCHIKLEDGREVYCDVGSGLSDTQREDWAFYPEHILGKVVQIGYHELTQNRDMIGTNVYSLRFPRLISIRNDKKETSEY